MNEITTLFTAIGDFFTNAAWFSMVKWPFWILLGTVALGGVYCARYGKKTLLLQGICGTLNLLTICIGSVILYIHFYSFMHMVLPSLPFLGFTDQAVTIIDPFTLGLKGAADVMLRLLILVMLLNGLDTLGSSGRSIGAWLFSQSMTILFGLFFYRATLFFIQSIFPSLLTKYAIIPVVGFLGFALMMLCAKFVFTSVITGGNPTFRKINGFFTTNKIGSIFTTSSLTFLLAILAVIILRSTHVTGAVYTTVNRTGLWLILLMLIAVLRIFDVFYVERADKKKG